MQLSVRDKSVVSKLSEESPLFYPTTQQLSGGKEEKVRTGFTDSNN